MNPWWRSLAALLGLQSLPAVKTATVGVEQSLQAKARVEESGVDTSRGEDEQGGGEGRGEEGNVVVVVVLLLPPLQISLRLRQRQQVRK